MPFKTTIRVISALVLIHLATPSSFGQQAEGQVRIETSARIDAMAAQKKEYNKNLVRSAVELGNYAAALRPEGTPWS